MSLPMWPGLSPRQFSRAFSARDRVNRPRKAVVAFARGSGAADAGEGPPVAGCNRAGSGLYGPRANEARARPHDRAAASGGASYRAGIRSSARPDIFQSKVSPTMTSTLDHIPNHAAAAPMFPRKRHRGRSGRRVRSSIDSLSSSASVWPAGRHACAVHRLQRPVDCQNFRHRRKFRGAATGTFFFVGMLAGRSSSAAWRDRIGRRPVLMTAVVIDALSKVAFAFAPDLTSAAGAAPAHGDRRRRHAARRLHHDGGIPAA